MWPGAFRGLLGSFWAVCLTLVGRLEMDLVGALASFRKFWAIAASRNSSCAPQGPRNRSRPKPTGYIPSPAIHIDKYSLGVGLPQGDLYCSQGSIKLQIRVQNQ